MNRLITIITLLVALALGSLGASGATKRVTLKYKAHAWILDGYLSIKHTGMEVYEPTVDIYCHCVWGWGGSGNGYFYIGNSTSKTGYEDGDREEIVTIDRSYINLHYLWDYKPNK